MNTSDSAQILQDSEVWEMTLPWLPIYWDLNILARYKRAGYTYVSLTLQDWPPTMEGTRRCIDQFKQLIVSQREWLTFAGSMAEIERGRAEGKLVLGLNSQETLLLGEDISNIPLLHAMGVRHMLLAYNVRNLVADGCAEQSDAGLSNFGRQVVQEMNQVGILVDGSHTGRRSTLEAIDRSSRPVIFSHSNAYSVTPHIRNLHDDQIRACAARGGVIGVVGVGAYLGDPEATADSMFRHIDYISALVGPEHVGLGTDFVNVFPARDYQHTWQEIAKVQKSWPNPSHAWPNPTGSQLVAEETRCFGPEQLAPLIELFLSHGYSVEAVTGILGGNFRRVYASVM